MNKNWKSYWKLVANNKENTAVHHAQYCLMKAFGAKANNKIEIAHALLRKAFTPPTNTTDNWAHVRSILRTNIWIRTIFGLDASLFFDEKEAKEFDEFRKLVAGVDIKEPDYLFIFVRQDISREQQAVQAAHATFKAGCIAGKTGEADPNTTNFVLIGVEDEAALVEAREKLYDRGISYAEFVEPDLDNSLTAIASQPLKEHRKRFLKRYKLLSFE
jgi:hypothetical protein